MANANAFRNHPRETSNVTDLVRDTENMALRKSSHRMSTHESYSKVEDVGKIENTAHKVWHNEEPTPIVQHRHEVQKENRYETISIQRATNQLRIVTRQPVSNNPESPVVSPTDSNTPSKPRRTSASHKSMKDLFEDLELKKLAFNEKRALYHDQKEEWDKAEIFTRAMIKILNKNPKAILHMVTEHGMNITDCYLLLMAAQTNQSKWDEALETANKVTAIGLKPVHELFSFVTPTMVDLVRARLYYQRGDLKTAKVIAENGIMIMQGKKGSAVHAGILEAALELAYYILKGLGDEAEAEFYISMHPRYLRHNGR
ncbi:hypothetical protein H072_8470 [Dactylellina haptotyla CBS 200.50]|uniref:Uncharacterized protein n=1 Tax=Dactylellina haptotyla (strain CBS 200.50) TaxID=1284197 RepID=S8BF49_DACHA|nr:hypothetical protein H072_8470 [Dactylellina haptotyla CBS 200.50]